MGMNPFSERPQKLDKGVESWKALYPDPIAGKADRYTRLRLCMLESLEWQAIALTRHFGRHCLNNELRRELALLRRAEQQQQKKISMLSQADDNILERAVCLEQMSVEVSAQLAQNEADSYVRKAIDFALIEDFDHLYRFAGLWELEEQKSALNLVEGYTEIMPGRPSIAQHRHPYDAVKRSVHSEKVSVRTRLHIGIITALEEYILNVYMLAAPLYRSELGRTLFMEIAMAEEQHVSQYESLIDSGSTWLERLLLWEYTECYLYYSLVQEERDAQIKKVMEQYFLQEIAHLHKAAELMKQYENKEWQQVIPEGEFPQLFALEGTSEKNKAYIRFVIEGTLDQTSILEEYIKVDKLPENYPFFKFNSTVNQSPGRVPSHKVIQQHIAEFGTDYRFEEKAHPVKRMQNRTKDETDIGR